MHYINLPRALLPEEMNQIDQLFRDILRERGLPRNCETAEAIARRMLSYYQGGIREIGALNHMLGFDSPAVAWGNDSPFQKLQNGAEEQDENISPEHLEMLQRTFDRVCLWCNIPRYGRRADLLAKHIRGEFREGLRDEAALFDNAMWLEKHSTALQRRSDA